MPVAIIGLVVDLSIDLPTAILISFVVAIALLGANALSRSDTR